MQLSEDSTCNYHCCDQNGHSVCHKVADHYRRLIAAVNELIVRPGPDTEATVLAIIAENPDTSTVT
jgi:hypothetical protein